MKRMSAERRKRYRQLRAIRQERDYQTGHLQYANRPYSFPVLDPRTMKIRVITTKQFMNTFRPSVFETWM